MVFNRKRMDIHWKMMAVDGDTFDVDKHVTDGLFYRKGGMVGLNIDVSNKSNVVEVVSI